MRRLLSATIILGVLALAQTAEASSVNAPVIHTASDDVFVRISAQAKAAGSASLALAEKFGCSDMAAGASGQLDNFDIPPIERQGASEAPALDPYNEPSGPIGSAGCHH